MHSKKKVLMWRCQARTMMTKMVKVAWSQKRCKSPRKIKKSRWLSQKFLRRHRKSQSTSTKRMDLKKQKRKRRKSKSRRNKKRFKKIN